MWIFLPSGTAMPALIPDSVLKDAKTPDIQEAVANGWELQVRGRVKEHLQQFIDDYMQDLDHSKIYSSPWADYNVRFYTSRENYGIALYRASLDIDYVKFKDTSYRFPWGKKYHDLLSRIWAASLSLAPAGGIYGPKSKKNPRGYEKASKMRKRGNPRNPGNFIGSSFGARAWDEDDYDKPLGYDDLPEWATKSIHDMTDEELDELESLY